MTIQPIPCNQLVASPRNTRKVKTGIASLASSLAADGLLQNLVVVPRADGKFEVIAGERRRRAIAQLIQAGTWNRDTAVPCEVRESDEATGVSYAENAQRIAMHPADAIRAFAVLAGEGQDEAAIAHRYGYEPREVHRMLALASVSPKVIQALAADRIDVATAQAFTLTDDHAWQNRVLRRARGAREVRALLTERKITTSHRLFRFVGPDAYADAGGSVTHDLFGQDGEGYADDPALVQRLVTEKLDEAASAAEAEGWGEVRAAEQTPYESYQWQRLHPDEPPIGQGDDADHPFGRGDEETDEEEDEPGKHCFSPEAKAAGLLLITVSHDGCLHRAAYSRRPQRTAKRDARGVAEPRPLYDARVTEELSRVRTAALQAEIAANPPLALTVLLDALLPLVAGQASAHTVQLRGCARTVATSALSMREPASPFDPVADLLPAMPDEPDARWAWLTALDAAGVTRLLAACTGALIDASHGKYAEPARLTSADRIARAAGLDMRAHWEGGIEFYSRISRKAMLAALGEARGPAAAENCAKLKKPELAAACVARLAGTGWLPAPLVTPDVAADGNDHRDDDRRASDDEASASTTQRPSGIPLPPSERRSRCP